MSKKGKPRVSNEKIAEKSGKNRDNAFHACTVFRVHVRVICIYPKNEISLAWMKK
jgi:hypothetical protein